jgi:hypothetical protein
MLQQGKRLLRSANLEPARRFEQSLAMRNRGRLAWLRESPCAGKSGGLSSNCIMPTGCGPLLPQSAMPSKPEVYTTLAQCELLPIATSGPVLQSLRKAAQSSSDGHLANRHVNGILTAQWLT